MDENIEKDFETKTISHTVLIEEQDKKLAWIKCSWMKNANTRARMIANYLSVIAAKKIFANYNIKCDSSTCFQEISSIFSKWDIAELFIENCKISIRLNFDDYKLFVPKKHKRYGVLGNLLMFIKFEENSAKLLGFIFPDELDENNSDNENYYIDIDKLKTIDEIDFNTFQQEKEEKNINELQNERIKIIQYLENNLEDKIHFFKLLSESKYLRTEMIKFAKSEKIYTEIVEQEDKIKNEIQKEVNNIEKLADAFIQSKTTILNHSNNENNNAENYKIECARANLEKLFNLSMNNNEEFENIQNKTKDEVMDTLLQPSKMIINDDRLPMVAVLKAFRFFAILLLILFFTAGIYCFHNYYGFNTYNNSILKFKQNMVEWVINVKKK